ncbi:MAG: thioesterase [Rhizobium sp.]|nr:thioesterase [Rhizobium sp.]
MSAEERPGQKHEQAQSVDVMRLEALLVELAAQVLRKPVDPGTQLTEAFNINRTLRFVDAVWQATGIELDVNSFYLWPTLPALAAAIADGSYRTVPKLIEIRSGTKAESLVVFAGGVSCFLEMKDFINALSFEGTVYGMALSAIDRPAARPAEVADEVAACLSALQASGLALPYRLVGYSFGGVVALELARALDARGVPSDFLGLIDTPQSEHAWPLATWLSFAAGRYAAARRAKAATRGEAAPDAASEPGQGAQTGGWRRRLRRLTLRFRDPRHEDYPTLVPQWVGGYPPAYGRAARQLLRMKGLYRPQAFPAPLVFYRTQGGSPVDCDPKRIWDRVLPGAEWIDVAGNHQSIMVGRHAKALAADLSRRLSQLPSSEA